MTILSTDEQMIQEAALVEARFWIAEHPDTPAQIVPKNREGYWLYSRRSIDLHLTRPRLVGRMRTLQLRPYNDLNADEQMELDILLNTYKRVEWMTLENSPPDDTIRACEQQTQGSGGGAMTIA